MWLAFDALDVWFFRDGRPFQAGEAHWGRSRFPPPPETLLGATRALLIHAAFTANPHLGLDLASYNRWLTGGGVDDPAAAAEFAAAQQRFGAGDAVGADLDLCGPFVVAAGDEHHPEGRPLFTPPRDLMRTDQGGLVRLDPLADPRLAGLASASWAGGWGGATALTPRPLVTEARGGEELEPVPWIGTEGLRTYLRGLAGIARVTESPTKVETRTGIALGDGRMAREGHLYRVDVVRPRATLDGTGDGWTRLLARVTPDPDGGATGPWRLPFGGESRTAHVERLRPADPPVDEIEGLLAQSGRLIDDVVKIAVETSWLRLVLLQPAIFKEGWLPDAVDATTGMLMVGAHTFTLRSAAVGKPVAISGWDLKARAPKPLRRAVPSGSVYHFELTSATDPADAAKAFVARFHGKSELIDDQKVRRAGYGLSVVGACRPAMTAGETA